MLFIENLSKLRKFICVTNICYSPYHSRLGTAYWRCVRELIQGNTLMKPTFLREER